MSDNKFSRFFSGKGYYIALTLCAAAIGIMSYVYYSGQEQEAVQTANAPVSIVGTVSLPTRGRSPAKRRRRPSPPPGNFPPAPLWRGRC